MRRNRLLALALVALLAAPAAAQDRRCGVLENIATGEWSLTDAQGHWVLSTQAGHRAAGFDAIAEMDQRHWTEAGPSRGHGCACLVLRAEPGSRRVLEILSAEPLPPAACRR